MTDNSNPGIKDKRYQWLDTGKTPVPAITAFRVRLKVHPGACAPVSGALYATRYALG